jgi:hypothetical protein
MTVFLVAAPGFIRAGGSAAGAQLTMTAHGRQFTVNLNPF